MQLRLHAPVVSQNTMRGVGVLTRGVGCGESNWWIGRGIGEVLFGGLLGVLCRRRAKYAQKRLGKSKSNARAF